MTSVQRPHFSDAVILAKSGAMVYVTDWTGNCLSDGHHEVTWSGRDRFDGKTGAREERFIVDTDQIDPYGERFAREIELDDIVKYAADERIAAIAHYLKEYDHVPEVPDAVE